MNDARSIEQLAQDNARGEDNNDSHATQGRTGFFSSSGSLAGEVAKDAKGNVSDVKETISFFLRRDVSETKEKLVVGKTKADQARAQSIKPHPLGIETIELPNSGSWLSVVPNFTKQTEWVSHFLSLNYLYPHHHMSVISWALSVGGTIGCFIYVLVKLIIDNSEIITSIQGPPEPGTQAGVVVLEKHDDCPPKEVEGEEDEIFLFLYPDGYIAPYASHGRWICWDVIEVDKVAGTGGLLMGDCGNGDSWCWLLFVLCAIQMILDHNCKKVVWLVDTVDSSCHLFSSVRYWLSECFGALEMFG
ncbi:hypothetical protein Tco_0710901 [Tanacetum coccineum]